MKIENILKGGRFIIKDDTVFFEHVDGLVYKVVKDGSPTLMETLQDYLNAPFLVVYPKSDDDEEDE